MNRITDTDKIPGVEELATSIPNVSGYDRKELERACEQFKAWRTVYLASMEHWAVEWFETRDERDYKCINVTVEVTNMRGDTIRASVLNDPFDPFHEIETLANAVCEASKGLWQIHVYGYDFNEPNTSCNEITVTPPKRQVDGNREV